MIIIAFSQKTSKILPRLFCGKWKHVAPIVVHPDKLIMYQFIRPNSIQKIYLNMRDIHILSGHGWKFIYLNQSLANNFAQKPSYTCVQLVKNSIGIENIFIQTPTQLYNKIK